ncbi:exodeoxyribonuclease VII large subunit, partial [Patescibacteria group bacterium]|nr:exodeoxyribonuclease VII large subunit [Patescibacteria group bacterium]
FNQTVEYAFSVISIRGELGNFRVSKRKWVYFDLKDEAASISCFGSVYQLPGPLEEGMILRVKGLPRLHQRYGFSFNFSSITPVGVGSIKRASELLAAKLEKEGLFAPERKRPLPYPPSAIGLITASPSAALADFIQILKNRWVGLKIDLYSVSVQGETAADEISRALEFFSGRPDLQDVVVVIRGGGSPEDLAVFNSEVVTRAVASSRVPTLVAIGHESDISLAELAADRRASTPSNAAEILVPASSPVIKNKIKQTIGQLERQREQVISVLNDRLQREQRQLKQLSVLVAALSPQAILRRGYSIVRVNGQVSDGSNLSSGSIVAIELSKAAFEAAIVRPLEVNNNATEQ